MATATILLQLAIVLALIFIGARVGGNRKVPVVHASDDLLSITHSR